ncbi:unnamed protein product [Cyprideis torosa]|uniref:Uncharacterized protein n=1 Tax=Cyprideis torosa TaxID=163714 RepID=A0A7R8W5K7_9CRUS|nr:unnamed protein product [Cyprideis torosa]CAG0880977.1 unnamed protein product [Cyprideis torosa]
MSDLDKIWHAIWHGIGTMPKGDYHVGEHAGDISKVHIVLTSFYLQENSTNALGHYFVRGTKLIASIFCCCGKIMCLSRLKFISHLAVNMDWLGPAVSNQPFMCLWVILLTVSSSNGSFEQFLVKVPLKSTDVIWMEGVCYRWKSGLFREAMPPFLNFCAVLPIAPSQTVLHPYILPMLHLPCLQFWMSLRIVIQAVTQRKSPLRLFRHRLSGADPVVCRLQHISLGSPSLIPLDWGSVRSAIKALRDVEVLVMKRLIDSLLVNTEVDFPVVPDRLNHHRPGHLPRRHRLCVPDVKGEVGCSPLLQPPFPCRDPEEAMRKSWSDVPHGIHVAEYPLPVPGSSSLMPEEEERPVEDDVFRPRRRSLDSDKLPPSVPVSSCRPRGSSFSSTRDWRDWDSPSPQFDGVCSSGSVQEDTQNPAPSPDAETSDESPSGSGRQPPAPRTPSKATSIPKIIQKSQLPKDAFLSRQQMQSRMKTVRFTKAGMVEEKLDRVFHGGPPSITGFDLAPFEVEEVLNVLRSDIRIQPPWQRRRRGTSNKEKSNDRASSNALKSMEQNCNPLNKSEEPMSSVCDTIPSKSSSEGVLTPQCDDLSVVERKTPSPPPRTFQHPSPSSAGYRMTKPSLQLDKCGASCHHPPLVFRSPDRPTARALKFEHKPEPQVCHSPHSSSPTSQNSSPLPPSDISSSPCSSAVECLGSQSHKSPLLVDHFQRSVPSVSDQLQFRRSLDGAASLVFHRRTGLPLTSSPAPKRKGKAFDFDAGINSVTAIKNALFAVNIKDEEDADVETSLETSLVDSPESFSNNSPGEFNTDISSIRSSRPTSLSPQSFRNVSLIPLTKDITLPPPLSPTEEEKSVKISHSCPPSPPSHLSPLPSSPATSNLLGSFEESVLNGRIEPISTVHGFKADIGASGSFCPSHLTQPVSVFFYSLEGNSSPYLAHINLGKKGYRVPRSGTIQVTLFNPHGTVVKMFVILYDLNDMPPSSKTFLRQRTLYMPVGETDLSSESRKWLRYLIHLRFCTSKSGHLYLHTDIRMIVFRKSDLDTAVSLETDGKTHELRSFTRGPTDPKYSPKR